MYCCKLYGGSAEPLYFTSPPLSYIIFAIFAGKRFGLRIFTFALLFLAGFAFGILYNSYSSKIAAYLTETQVITTTASIPRYEILSKHLFFSEIVLQQNNYSMIAQLNSDVRVLCWIMTNPGNHENKAKHVRDTWGRRCDVLLFMTTADGLLQNKFKIILNICVLMIIF